MKNIFLSVLAAASMMAASAQQLYIGSYYVTSTSEESTYGDGNDKWANRQPVISDMLNFEQPDIMGMQALVKSQYDGLLEGMNGYQAVGLGADDGGNEGLFTPIFYHATIELLRNGHFWLSDTPETASKFAGAAACQVCTWAKMRKGTKDFYVFNVCFDTRAENGAASVALLLERIQTVDTEGLPYFVTGNIGTDEQSDVYAALMAQCTDTYTAAPVVSAEYGTLNAFDLAANHGTARYDFVLTSPSGVTVNSYGQLQYAYFTKETGNTYKRRLPSAHFPVMAKVVME